MSKLDEEFQEWQPSLTSIKDAFEIGWYRRGRQDMWLAESHITECEYKHSACCGACGCTIADVISKEDE